MKSVKAYIKQLQELEKTILYLDFTRQPIALQKIEQLEQVHGIQINPYLKQIFVTVGCTYWGLQDMGWEWIELANISCREDYADDARKRILAKSLVFSDDGAGNPIMINREGVIHIFYHDNEGYEQFAESIPMIIENFIQHLH